MIFFIYLKYSIIDTNKTHFSSYYDCGPVIVPELTTVKRFFPVIELPCIPCDPWLPVEPASPGVPVVPVAPGVPIGPVGP
jgi:hypothetical protein